MIVYLDKNFETHSVHKNKNWYNDGREVYVVDETTSEGKALAEKIMQHAPYYDFVLDEGGNLIDITPIDPPEPEPQPPTPEERLAAVEEALLLLLMEV